MKRPELDAVLHALLEQSTTTQTVALDAVGAAIGTQLVSTEEIDALFDALEAEGRVILSPAGGEGELWLRKVVGAARELKLTTTGKMTIDDVALKASLSRQQVIGALALLHIMQR